MKATKTTIVILAEKNSLKNHMKTHETASQVTRLRTRVSHDSTEKPKIKSDNLELEQKGQ